MGGRLTVWRRVDTTLLRRAVLDATALIPLIQSDPERAAEVVLAAMLEKPRADRHGLDMNIGIVERVGITRALPESGPMLAFLMHAPDTAVRTILQIIDHATRGWERSDWTGVADDGITTSFEIILDGEPVALTGNGNVMHWYRGDARVAVPLASTLMALEQYLYRKLDAEEDIGSILTTLMTSRSVAVFGVLVARYRPALLDGPLAPLATSAGLILADRLYKARDHGYLMMAVSAVEGARLRAWHTMPHRKLPIEYYIMQLVVGDGSLAGLCCERPSSMGARGERSMAIRHCANGSRELPAR